MLRRNFIRTCISALASLLMVPQNLFAGISGGNFKEIYSNIKLKNEFFKFLKNVFNLMPEEDLHKLIADTAERKTDDKSIYLAVQEELDDITPMFSSVRYSLPALKRQKDEMAKQTLELLGSDGNYDGTWRSVHPDAISITWKKKLTLKANAIMQMAKSQVMASLIWWTAVKCPLAPLTFPWPIIGRVMLISFPKKAWTSLPFTSDFIIAH